MSEKVVAHASCGTCVGKKTKNGFAFLGIPYGKAERFCAPEAVSWENERECLAYGESALQPNYLGRRPEGLEFQCVGSEDCLNLNVWTSSLEKDAGLPVVVYIHGGAFQVGSNCVAAEAGDLFMEETPMVFVSINYRLGVFGFLELADSYGEKYAGSSNNGMRDQLLALQWINENIASFGGDPTRVTLMGISAGAKSIGALITLPEVQKQCHQVILESGGTQALRTVKTAKEISRRFLESLPEGWDVLTVPAEKLIRLQAEFCGCEGSVCFFGPVLCEPFHEDWRERWVSGKRFRGSAVIGSSRNELAETVKNPYFESEKEQLVRDLFGDHYCFAIEKQKEQIREGMKEEESWIKVLSDFMYRYYSDALAKALWSEGNPVWVYSVEISPAIHAMGFYYLMNSLEPSCTDGKKAAEALSSFFRKQIRSFICTGSPDSDLWPEYRGKFKMMLDEKPHMEEREEDTLTGFPEQVFTLKGLDRGRAR